MSNFIKKLFSSITSEAHRQGLQDGISLELPKGSANELLDYMLERQYLSDIAAKEHFDALPLVPGTKLCWIKLFRLPVHPNQKQDYDLFARWQSVLASLHTWDDKLIFLLQRENGFTSIYLGLKSFNAEESMMRLGTALKGCMPGIKIEALTTQEQIRLIGNMDKYRSAGAVTFRLSVKIQIILYCRH